MAPLHTMLASLPVAVAAAFPNMDRAFKAPLVGLENGRRRRMFGNGSGKVTRRVVVVAAWKEEEEMMPPRALLTQTSVALAEKQKYIVAP